MKSITLLGSLVLVLLMVACSSSFSKEGDISESASDWAYFGGPSGAPGIAVEPDYNRATGGGAGESAREEMQYLVDMAAPAAPAPSMAPFEQLGLDVTTQSKSAADGDLSIGNEPFDDSAGNTDEQAALVSQQRIIVRTVNMQLVVDNVAGSVDDISALARNAGGWVVSSNRATKHQGSVAVRVPAEQLDAFVVSLRGLAVEVDSESSTSRDVTGEYVDNKSRLTILQATEQALIELLDQARSVEDALDIQRELSRYQSEIEVIQGRIKFLEETAAFSLVSVGLRLAPQDMVVDAGNNQTYSVGQFAKFRATFAPPEDIDEFLFTWDFGDGTPKVTGIGTIPSVEEGHRFTATVNHTYFDDKNSPYIVEIEVMGTGDGGVVEGSDTFVATVTRIPTIVVFAGERKQVKEGEEVEFVGSFTRPEGLRDIQYVWDFGDQSAQVTATPDEGVTRAIVTHVYADHMPFDYTATLTVTAQSDAGQIETISQVNVFVAESEGLVISGWSAKDTAKTAIRALSGLGQMAGTVVIYGVFLSPLWLVIGAVLYFGGRRVSARRRSRAEATQSEEQVGAQAESENSGAQ